MAVEDEVGIAPGCGAGGSVRFTVVVVVFVGAMSSSREARVSVAEVEGGISVRLLIVEVGAGGRDSGSAGGGYTESEAVYTGDSGRGLGFEAGRLGFGDDEVSVDEPSGRAVVGVIPDALAAVVEDESVMMYQFDE